MQIESTLSLVTKGQKSMYVSHNEDDQNSVCSDIVDCQWLTSAGNYSQGYIGAEGNKENTYKRGCMSKSKDQK